MSEQSHPESSAEKTVQKIVTKVPEINKDLVSELAAVKAHAAVQGESLEQYRETMTAR
jgi:hypothetical protein